MILVCLPKPLSLPITPSFALVFPHNAEHWSCHKPRSIAASRTALCAGAVICLIVKLAFMSPQIVIFYLEIYLTRFNCMSTLRLAGTVDAESTAVAADQSDLKGSTTRWAVSALVQLSQPSLELEIHRGRRL